MVQTPQEARAFIAERSSLNPKANHNCWGYKTGVELSEHPIEIFSSDDGEPSGTAGKPIIGSIERNEITNTVIVVTRYFGGHKLGIRGLIDAYSEASQGAIQQSGINQYNLFSELKISSGYSEWQRIEYEFGRLGIIFNKENVEYTSRVDLSVSVQVSKLEEILKLLHVYKMNGLDITYESTGREKYRITNKIL